MVCAGAVREQHKIGVIYIGRHHDDKTAIMTCRQASAMFDEFVGSLGWMVSIDTHQGYLGNLKKDMFQGMLASSSGVRGFCIECLWC